MAFTALIDPETKDVTLKIDGDAFGRLSNCEVAYIFEPGEGFEALEDYVQLEGDMSLREMLAAVRAGYEACVNEHHERCRDDMERPSSEAEELESEFNARFDYQSEIVAQAL